MLLEDGTGEFFPPFGEELAATILSPEEMPWSSLGASLQRLYRMPRWETALGAALSVGLHASLLLAAMLITRTLPQSIPQPQFVMVSLAEAGAGGPAGGAGADGGPGERAAISEAPSAGSSVAALNAERLAAPQSALQSAQPAVTEKEPPGRDDPPILEPPPSPQSSVAPNRLKPITRQPVRPVKPKAEKEKRYASAETATPQLPEQAESRMPAGPRPDPEAAPASSGLSGTGDQAGPHMGEGTGTKFGSGGSHHGLGAGTGEYTVKQVDRAPAILRKVEPEFPEAARKMGLTGKVVAKFLVGVDGQVSRASILEAVPQGIFDQAVLKALQRWEFRPGTIRNRAVATWIVLPINFRLTQ